jgi:hypothetical protein
MKVRLKSLEKKFNPVDLNIIIKSKEDLNILRKFFGNLSSGSIMNIISIHSEDNIDCICQLFEDIYRELEHYGK